MSSASPGLGPAELARYRRHLSLPEVGIEGQRAFRDAHVLIVGAGGLGSPAAMYLAAAGVGTLGLVDDDTVDPTNLQRQLLYRETDVGRSKIAAARETLAGINPLVEVIGHEARLDRHNALDLIGGYDLVLNGCDNFPTRYLVSDACVLTRTPCVDGSVYRFEGQATVYDTDAGGPCYRCRFPHPPDPSSVPSCAEAGVLGILPGIVGTLQAAEALKLILARAGLLRGEPLIGRVLMIDVLAMEFVELSIDRDPACPACGDQPTITELIDYEEFCGGAASGDFEDLARSDPEAFEITPPALAERLTAGDELLLIDVREEWEWQLCRIEGARLMPLSTFPAAAELPRGIDIVTYCHVGMRSLEAVRQLRRQGYRRARSLRGGIDAWSRLIDPAVPRY